MEILLLQTDITTLKVDAIANAANSKLAGGGGVDGAIHRAAGPQLIEACQKLNGCPTGQSKITDAYQLPAKYVIHSVGPIWRGGQNQEAELLKSCYQTAMNLAIENKCKSIAFPNISTGIYGFPKREAATIAIDTIKEFSAYDNHPESVYFVCFDEVNFNIYKELLYSS